jgi:hypothetical protein
LLLKKQEANMQTSSMPFRATYFGHVTPPEVVSESPLTVFVVTNATGDATPLGAYMAVYPHNINQETLEFMGQLTMTAADGDQVCIDLKGDLALTATEGEFDLVNMVGIIRGGTGRFVHATGTITGTGQASLNTLTVQATFEGSISAHQGGSDD